MKRGRAALFSCLVLVCGGLAGRQSPYYADKGAALGGLAGGLTGAALGDRSGHAVGGALVGSAVGALTGAAVGDSMDAELERRQATMQQQTRLANTVSISDVKQMAASGLGDDVIINHIRTNGVRRNLTPREIIQLHEQGVSEAVIDAMQQEAASPPAPVSVVRGPPVVIEESYVVPGYWGPPRPRYYHHPPRYYRRRPGVSWGLSYSN